VDIALRVRLAAEAAAAEAAAAEKLAEILKRAGSHTVHTRIRKSVRRLSLEVSWCGFVLRYESSDIAF